MGNVYLLPVRARTGPDACYHEGTQIAAVKASKSSTVHRAVIVERSPRGKRHRPRVQVGAHQATMLPSLHAFLRFPRWLQ